MEDKFEELLRRATLGDATAQAELGIAYFKGDVTGSPDIEKGVLWCEKSAKYGSPESQFELAGILSDLEFQDKAFFWYNKAAERGHVKSQAKLASYYFAGISVKKDEKKAWDWAEKAFINKEYSEAPVVLAILLLKGDVVEQNSDMAYRLLTIAESNGNETAKQFKEQMEVETNKAEKSANTRSKCHNNSYKTTQGLVSKYSSTETVGRYEDERIYKGYSNDLVGRHEGKRIYRGHTTEIAGIYEGGYIYRGYTTEVAGRYENGYIYKGGTSEVVGTYNSENEIPAIALLMLL